MGGKLLKALHSLYDDNTMCVRVGEKCEWFKSKLGLRKGCVMSPWLFNIYMDGVAREICVRAKEME